GTYEIDLATKKVTTCGNFNAIVGIEGEVSNEQLLSKLHPEDLPAREKAHQDAFLTGRICYESRILNQVGSARWAKING
ncbi:PAS domain-containing protein, partial [Paraburkholderia sp. SIMBA_053]|uniref:PAS domain-containing protein n=1 Tax=Paraburkholderia sp. SIMBA_053 TaxID=3085794 RepID=UPI00397E7940